MPSLISLHLFRMPVVPPPGGCWAISGWLMSVKAMDTNWDNPTRTVIAIAGFHGVGLAIGTLPVRRLSVRVGLRSCAVGVVLPVTALAIVKILILPP